MGSTYGFSFIPTLHIYIKSRTNLHVENKNKDLFVDIVVVSIIYQLIILVLKLLFVC